MTRTIASDWVERFFDEGYIETFRRLGKYDTTHTDITSLLELAPIPTGARVLDVPCGWGRHAGELRALGYNVVGVDSSLSQIRRARQQWPDIDFYQLDMRSVPGGNYAAVLNLWTSFGSLPTERDDLAALTSWYNATKTDGYLAMELTTREFAESANRQGDENVGHKTVITNGVREDATFDWANGISYNTYTRGDWARTCVTRLYTRPELGAMLHHAGYKDVQMYGSFTGQTIRDDARTVLLARKRRVSRANGLRRCS